MYAILALTDWCIIFPIENLYQRNFSIHTLFLFTFARLRVSVSRIGKHSKIIRGIHLIDRK